LKLQKTACIAIKKSATVNAKFEEVTAAAGYTRAPQANKPEQAPQANRKILLRAQITAT
jgi:hypothetical protein